jgi:hypothetical protein
MCEIAPPLKTWIKADRLAGLDNRDRQIHSLVSKDYIEIDARRGREKEARL